MINYPDGHKTAKEVWDKDLEKKEIANKYGYKVEYIWEKDMNLLSDDDLKLFIIQMLEDDNETGKSQEDY